METMWRQCIRNGGAPDYILAGSRYIDNFRTQALAAGGIQRYTELPRTGGSSELDPSVKQDDWGVYTGLHFQGVPIKWDPVFDDLDAALSPTTPWGDRCYFINCNHMRLRPAAGHDMVPRSPPREHDKYIFYWALTWKGHSDHQSGKLPRCSGVDRGLILSICTTGGGQSCPPPDCVKQTGATHDQLSSSQGRGHHQ